MFLCVSYKVGVSSDHVFIYKGGMLLHSLKMVLTVIMSLKGNALM